MATDNPLQATPLYHGTRDASARIILRDGFRRSRSRSYTGTGICLSESLTVAYEYGMYETGGRILEARLAPHAPWGGGVGDNVWVVWTPGVLVSVRRMSHREAIRRLCAEFDEDGPQCGYNGVVQ